MHAFGLWEEPRELREPTQTQQEHAKPMKKGPRLECLKFSIMFRFALYVVKSKWSKLEIRFRPVISYYLIALF